MSLRAAPRRLLPAESASYYRLYAVLTPGTPPAVLSADDQAGFCEVAAP